MDLLVISINWLNNAASLQSPLLKESLGGGNKYILSISQGPYLLNNVFLVQSSFTVLFTVGQHSRSVKTQPSQTFELWCTFSFWLFMTWVIPPIDCCKEEVAICNFSLTLANFSIVLASCIFLQWQNSYISYMRIQAFTLKKNHTKSCMYSLSLDFPTHFEQAMTSPFIPLTDFSTHHFLKLLFILCWLFLHYGNGLV